MRPALLCCLLSTVLIVAGCWVTLQYASSPVGNYLLAGGIVSLAISVLLAFLAEVRYSHM